MGIILYGTHVFTKFMGYYGGRTECPVCHRVNRKGYVRNFVWAHLDYIPLFPIKKTYFCMCPICGNGLELKNKDAKREMINGPVNDQNFEIYAKHFSWKKPKETSYEIWIRNLFTGEEICLAANTYKGALKEIKKERGLKNIPVMEFVN